MARIGVFCFPGTGHINPMTALARTLERRGHSVVIYGIADTEARIRAAGIEFMQIGAEHYPLGTLRQLDEHLGTLKGLATFKFTVERVRNTARMILRDGPDAVRRSGAEVLLVDEADMGGTVAEYLGLPFVSIAMFPPLIRDARIPAFCFPWQAGESWWIRLRNILGFRLLSRVASPIHKLVNAQRRAWGLEVRRHAVEFLSPIAQIAQLPAALEFDVQGLPDVVHYTGPFVDQQQRPPVEFPWEKLDGRPLVYASLGTMQNGSESIFRTIAEASAGLPVQLVISLGGGLAPERLGELPGEPIVVSYAPQLELVKKAAVVITHAGLNTVLESLAEGVPLVCIPLGNDQPGVAARVAARRAGLVVERSKLNAKRLGAALAEVLGNAMYRESAARLRDDIRGVDGLNRAADVIEGALRLKGKGQATEIRERVMQGQIPALGISFYRPE
ncbi:glycosyltransferase [Occallatibacter riparius]|uniref:Glycosyltransferase n=1 Tax=Occallatibacter riparius TaxID=1002689 RepID=A0A9J7BIJ6_9BACT|nr:glycosyltransferase [Occallatibacter riparius]UWZ82624.1 glycosyltransferase [Occallatibacter riparius]